MIPRIIRKTAVAFVMQEGGRWQRGPAPRSAPIVGMADGKVWDEIAREYGCTRVRPNVHGTNRQRKRGFARLRKRLPFLPNRQCRDMWGGM